MRKLETVDADSVIAVSTTLFATLNDTSRADIYLSLIRMANRSIPDLRRLDQPEGARPYK
jgi:hypothetical protein